MAAEPRLDRDVVRTALIDILADETAVLAVYLFGSVARGTAGPLSDIDVGLLLEGPQKGHESVVDRATHALRRRLRTSRVDVLSLADAPMPLRYRVVRDGTLVLCRDAAARQRFIAASVLHYLDFQPLRERAFAVQRGAILADR